VARSRVAPLGLVLLGAILALAVWTVTRPAGGGAAATPDLVQRTLSAVQTPSANEFPTIPSAVEYLVEQVRTQNLAGATRVLPIAYLMEHASFDWEANHVQSASASGQLPGQPLSHLYEELGLLDRDYVLFGADLLHPGFTRSGVVPLQTPAAVQRFQAQLDPRRLSHLAVASVTTKVNTTRTSGLSRIGVSRIAEAAVKLTGVGRPQTADVLLYRIGSNWLVLSVQVE
jgi:hypothetical protein